MSNKVNPKSPDRGTEKEERSAGKEEKCSKDAGIDSCSGYGAWYGSSSTFMAGVKRCCKRQIEMGNGSRRGTV